MSRTVVSVCFLALILRDSTAMGISKIVNVSAGDDVFLPCRCSEKFTSVVWQIGEHTLVKFYNTTGSPSTLYKDRSQLFVPNKERNCSLLLKSVSLSDNTTFTCYVLGPGEKMMKHDVRLNVQAAAQTTPDYLTNTTDTPVNSKHRDDAGISFGVPFSLIALLLAGVIIILLIRCHRQRPRTMVVVDAESGQSILSHTSV
ncbi:uncharacterized protein LOC143511868 [Brachyhypopomus gauderio]|uniref:uncharacterized protein LOC143511868 n=1 Tax=Brachyhypopomus gauderio TaxID=698409 RepID=UPI004041CAF6